MGVNITRVLNIIEKRFDYQSARNIINNWKREDRIKEELTELSDDNLRALLAYLETEEVGEVVKQGIEGLILGGGAKVEEKKVDPPVIPAPPVVKEEAKAPVEEAKAPVEENKAPAEDAKKDAKDAKDGDDGGKNNKKKRR